MGHTLIISEKPRTAERIAYSISTKKPVRKKHLRIPYYELNVNGEKVVLASAVGHLYGLKQRGGQWSYPVFDVEWKPLHQVDRSKRYVKDYIDLLKHLAKGADRFIIATDWDIEGELLGYNALRFGCGIKEAQRMRFNTLTKRDLVRAYEHLDTLDYNLAAAGETRHVIDWYFGVNLSRALSLALKNVANRFQILSTGRVQGPCLAFLVERQNEIESFRPVPYWEVSLVLVLGGKEFVASHEKGRFQVEDEARRVYERCAGKPAVVSGVKRRSYSHKPPVPFDLGQLQAEAYRNFGYSPVRTQQIAQDLYEAGLISYPRTGSQKLPPSIGYKQILEKLMAFNKDYEKTIKKLFLLERLEPVQGKKDDPAHPAIYPTGESPEKLRGPHQKLYDMIARRFIAVFDEDATRESVTVEFLVEGERFVLRGRRTVKMGWMEIYKPYLQGDEVVLPEFEEGGKITSCRVEVEEKKTKPPPRYNPSSVIKELERRGLGTKATRADILQTLYERGYIEGKQIRVTELGVQVVETLRKHCSEIIDENLTRNLEESIEKIKQGVLTSDEVLRVAREHLTKILLKFKEHEKEIGEELAKAVRETLSEMKILGKCNRCGGGDLKIIVSKDSRKRFAGCTNYSKGKCSNAYPLPQEGRIVATGKVCTQCGTPIIEVRRKGKRSFKMCLDPGCESKSGWGRDNRGRASSGGGQSK